MEERIEFIHGYFGYMNDLNHKGAAMDKIRKDLFKMNKQLRLKQEAEKEVKDPQAALNDFISNA